ncbi:hypothetical protein [Leucobacter sp. M11]|uniref:hypothetical protein n=1 Tax=Leucobacter sp. M11 TaxID=2993565 RepID=UPI002D7FC142|nr:hypothetical protein [Leucobacter sp. M11]MEB4614775.1 hypothetical protein [Leucobacter sp. M11]
MKNITNAVRLHLNKRESFFGVPLYILGMGAVISVVIALTFQRFGSEPGTPDYIEGAQANGGLVWAVTGYLGYYGVQSVATTFPFALALGTTRRAYVAGTAIANALLAGYITAVLAVLLGLELLTDHWFFGLYLTDVMWLGYGNVGWLITIAFLGLFSVLSLGGLFAAAWVRFGSKGSIALALILGLLLAVALLVFAPNLIDIIAGFRPWMGVLAAVLAAGLSVTGTWLLMRRAAVR